eukprot:207949-Amorphochlora_amoeboformis.AAC.1
MELVRRKGGGQGGSKTSGGVRTRGLRGYSSPNCAQADRNNEKKVPQAAPIATGGRAGVVNHSADLLQ